MENKEQQIKNVLKNVSINPNPEWVVNTRNNLIDKLNAESNSAQFNFLNRIQMRAKVLSTIFLVLIVSIAGIGTTLHAAVTSKPGDFLFGLNKAIENIQRSTTSNPDDKLNLEKQILDKRLNDLNDLKQTQDANKIALAQKEVEDQQGKVAEIEGSKEGSNPVSFPKQHQDNSTENNVENSTEDQNEQEHSGTTNSTNSDNQNNSGSNSETNKTENETENHNSGSTNTTDTKSGDSNKSGKDGKDD